jgi:pilus assembly protein CpaC
MTDIPLILKSLKMLGRCCLMVMLVCFSFSVQAADQRFVSVTKGYSLPLVLDEDVDTIALGRPGVVGVVTLKPNMLMLNGESIGATSLTIFGKSGVIYNYTVRVSNDVSQLAYLIRQIEPNVTVEDANGVIVLRGTVPTPAALARVLSVADRYVDGGTGTEPNFSVISDRGGILAGNTSEQTEMEPVELDVGLQTLNVGRGGGGRGSASISNALEQKLMDNKGNLAQNIARGDVVTVAKGKVMSLIKVEEHPRVEMQLRIVAIDRNKTDEFGIDWRLDGNKVLIGNTTGGVANRLTSAFDPAAGGQNIDPGSGNLVGFFLPGKYGLSTFVRAIERKGAGKTLSEPLLTALSGESASFLVGGSVPIPTQTLAAGNATSNALSATNVRYIQYGLSLVVRPTVLESGKISIVLDQSISTPDYSNQIQVLGASIPGFNQRTVSTITESDDGETWAVAGLLSEEDTKALKQVPLLGNIPILGWLFRSTNDQVSRSELMILMTARVIKGANDTTQGFDGHGDLQPSSAPQAPQPAPAPGKEPLAAAPARASGLPMVTAESSVTQPRQMTEAGEPVLTVASEVDGAAVPVEAVLKVPDTETVFPGAQKPYIAIRKPKVMPDAAGSHEVAVEPDQVNRL